MAAFLAGLVGLGRKRSGVARLGSPPAPTSSLSSADEMGIELGLSRGLQGEGSSGSSHKRQRRQLASGPTVTVCQSRCNPLSGPLYDNPLFDEETDTEEFGFQEAADGKQGFWPDENESPLGKCGSGLGESEDQFAEFTPVVGPACPLSAFLAELGSTPVLCALTMLERRRMHPVGAEDYACLEVTIAAMLVLCRRASLGADEMTPDLLLTCLWLLMSCGSQYHSALNYNANLFLHLHPDGAAMLGPLKERMVALQVQMLQRCNWRVVLRDSHELHAALTSLGQHPMFSSMCDYLGDCAQHGWLPIGSHGHSPSTAAAVAQAEAGSAVPRPGSGSAKSSQSGLDGPFWQLAAPASVARSTRQQSKQQQPSRGVLAPRNRS